MKEFVEGPAAEPGLDSHPLHSACWPSAVHATNVPTNPPESVPVFLKACPQQVFHEN